MKAYKWKKASRFRGNAQKIGKCLEAIKAKKGKLTPQFIVAEAKSKKNPLHRYFEWKDTIAAQKYREDQARALIRSIRVTIIGNGKKEQIAYVNVRYKKGKHMESVYMSPSEALSDAEYRIYVLEEALEYLEGAKNRFSFLTELSKVFKEVESARSKYEKSRKKRKAS